MQNKRKIILGISPGSHTMGLAVLKESELVEWRMKVFNQVWSEKKLERIIKVIQRKVEKYEITVIALKVLDSSRSSDGLIQLISAITDLAKSQKVGLYTCTITDIKRHCSKDEKCTKGVVVEYVLQKHPQLHREHQMELENKKPYYMKTFEAIAVARMCGENKSY